MILVSTICQLYHWCQFYLSSHKGVTGTPCQGWILNRSHLTRSRNWHQTIKITTTVVSRTCETFVTTTEVSRTCETFATTTLVSMPCETFDV